MATPSVSASAPLTPPAPPAYSIYRASSLGLSLLDALKQMKAEDELDAAQVNAALLHFDAAINAALAERVNNSITLSGSLDVYRHCDNIWTLLMRDIQMVAAEGMLVTSAIKVVAPEARRRGGRTKR